MNLLKLFYSIRYTHFVQLVARLNLLAKRKFSERASRLLNKRFNQQVTNVTIADKVPAPLFSKRSGYFKITNDKENQFALTFLNETHQFQLPINWHPKKLEYGTRLWKLNLHYHEFLEEVDNEWFNKIIENWIDQNPPYKKGYWLDSWNSFSLSIRVVVWMQQVEVRQGDLSKSFVQKISSSLHKQLAFLYHNIENDIRGNHIIKNIKALLWGGAFFKDNKVAEKWTNRGKELLKRELDEQILKDGFHFERSPAYHGQVFADLSECYHVLEDCRLKNELGGVLNSMADVLNLISHPDGKYSLFNDGGLVMAYSPIELIQHYENLFDTKTERSKEIDLSESGYFGLKSDKDLFLYDAGIIAPDTLPAHGHGDIFSFEWTIDGQRVFIDKGVYEYNAGQRRDESRSTLSHNTVNIEGKDQCEFWGAFRVARRARVEVLKKRVDKDSLYIKANHTGYLRLGGKPLHQRTIDFDGKCLLITDETINGNGQHTEARFLLHPDIKLINKNGFVLIIAGEKKIKFESSSKIEVIDSSWYPNFGVEIECKQLVVHYGQCPIKGKCKIEVIN